MKILKFVPILLFTRFETKNKKFVFTELKISFLNFRNFCGFFLELSFDKRIFDGIFFSLSRDYCAIKLFCFYISFGYGIHSSILDIERFKINEQKSSMFGSYGKISYKNSFIIVNKIVEKYLK